MLVYVGKLSFLLLTAEFPAYTTACRDLLQTDVPE